MMPRDEAISLFEERNEPYKVEIIASTPDQDEFPIYFCPIQAVGKS